MVFEGDAVIVRAAVALLIAKEGELSGCETPEQVGATLRKPLLLSDEDWVKLLRDVGRSSRTAGTSSPATN